MSKADQVYRYTAAKLEYLHSIRDTGAGRAYLAELRRGVGKAPGELPVLWGMLFDHIPEELPGSNTASPAEWAVYTALTLYALHCQGNDVPMHQKDVSFGSAAAKLAPKEEDTERILRRLHMVATSASPADLAYHLRGIVQLLSSEGIPLDYARLAKELYLCQFESSANAVKLQWGRDFYNVRNHTKEEKENG